MQVPANLFILPVSSERLLCIRYLGWAGASSPGMELWDGGRPTGRAQMKEGEGRKMIGPRKGGVCLLCAPVHGLEGTEEAV